LHFNVMEVHIKFLQLCLFIDMSWFILGFCWFFNLRNKNYLSLSQGWTDSFVLWGHDGGKEMI
jgi:hypothetical protein